MSGPVKRTLFFSNLALPDLPGEPGDYEVVGLDGLGVTSMQYILDQAELRLLEQMPTELLQRNLGALRKRIVSDPEGEDAQEAMESYWARVESTTLTEVLLVESRIWEKHMEADSPALQRIAVRAFYRIVQNENYLMRATEAFRGTHDLLARIEQGDVDSSRVALVIYQGFVERFFRNRRDLIAMEASGFRTMARAKIHNVLSGDQAGDVDADMISHLNNLLAVYTQIVFYEGIDLVEIGDGIEWMESYIREGHSLEQCAKEVRASLDITRDLLEHEMDPPDQVAPLADENPGNVQDPIAGLIDTTKNSLSVGKVLDLNASNVIVASSIQLFGSKIKPV